MIHSIATEIHSPLLHLKSFIITVATIIIVSLAIVVVLVLVVFSSQSSVSQDLLSWPTCLDLAETIMSTQGSNHTISLQHALVRSSAQAIAASLFQLPFYAMSPAWSASTSSAATQHGTGPLLQSTARANIIFINIDWKSSRHINTASTKKIESASQHYNFHSH